MNNDIRQTWFLEHSPEVVWQCLTESEIIAQWLMQNDFKPEVGYKFKFKTKPQKAFGFDGNIDCEVLEVLPYKKLSYSWKGGPGEGKITLDSVVTWTLQPKDNGTELLLEHTGFSGMKNYLASVFMNEGWKTRIKARFVELVNSAGHENTSN